MALLPQDAHKYSIDQIRDYYKGTGYRPTRRSIFETMMREQLLQLKEMLAFAIEMGEATGYYGDMTDAINALGKAVNPVEKYVKNRGKHKHKREYE